MIIFPNLKKGKCPFCGAVGKTIAKHYKVKNCPVCGTIFNEFGIILMNELEEMINENN